MIKVIAFDLVGVLVNEKDIRLSCTEKKLERLFGDNISDDIYLKDAEKIVKNKNDIIPITKNIIEKLYKIKEENLIRNLKKKYNNIKIIIATNHVTFVKDYIKNNFKEVDDIIISAQINKIKPDKGFYKYIIDKYLISPEELLFLDDNEKNISSAKEIGINTIYVKKDISLYDEILKIINNDIEKNYYKAYETRYKQIYQNNELWTEQKPTPDVIKTIDKIKLTKASKILEIGCGEGRDAISLLKKNYDVLAIDYSDTVIKKCNELSKQKYKKNFKQFDVIIDKLNEKFDFIYSVAVIHMFVNKDHRKKFLDFINDHLKEKGLALIASMGDGEKTYSSDISKSFEITDRYIHNKTKVKVATTSCKIVNWNQFEKELENSNLRIKEKWISKEVPGFDKVMFVLIERN